MESQKPLSTLHEELAQLHVAAAKHIDDLRTVRTEIEWLERQIAARQTPPEDWE